MLRIPTLLLLLLIIQFNPGCASILSSDIQQPPRNDAVVMARVKAQFIEAAELDAAALWIESNQGVVTLSGFVESDAQKNQAAALAQQVNGVRQIINNIEVK